MGKEKTVQNMKKMKTSPRERKKAEVRAAKGNFEKNLSAKRATCVHRRH